MDRRQLEALKRVMEADFTRLDLNLFLDTHPDNRQAVRDYQRVCEEVKALKRAYEDQYGPLTPVPFGRCPDANSPWPWIDEPWPWEIEYC